MTATSIISISLGAAIGALSRWYLSILFNTVFPTIPFGTLAANIIGGFLMGVFIALSRNHLFVSETSRLAIATGFLGGLTTFSTFSAETVNLITHQEYFWTMIMIISHVGGSILATILGIYTIKLFL